MTALRILIADDHAAVRRGIRSLVQSHPEWQVVGEATDGQEAVEQARRLKPDIALLDMSMPELNGLEATRQILKDSPGTQAIILTVHQSDELADEARRAGVRRLILKSNADELIKAIEALRRRAIHLAGAVVGHLRHIAAFFQSEAERYRVLGPFVAEGLSQGEKAFHIIEPPKQDLHLSRLTEAGIDVDRAAAQRQLELVAWEEMPLRHGHFDQHAMLKRIEGVFTDTSARGFPLTRFVANMEWALEPRPGVEDLVEFEARYNYLSPKFDDVAICAYDLTKFSGSLVIDAMRTHPAVVIGGSLRENPFYVPPDQMIEELRQKNRAGSG
jgi:DNA-binding NarL/FixJ family response regulator